MDEFGDVHPPMDGSRFTGYVQEAPPGEESTNSREAGGFRVTDSPSSDGRSIGIYRSGLFLLVLIVAISFLVGGAAADGHEHYVVEQGNETYTVGAIVDDETTAEGFYDYRAPHTDPHAYTYSSHGTMEYQQDDASILLLYDGPEGASLVIVHDRYREDRYAGTRGGTASFEVSGLPADGEWVVEDDDYDGQTDVFTHSGSESDMHWIWSTGRTDGAVFTGIEADSEITIDPRFNEEALLEPNDYREDGVISDWQLIDATDDGFDRISLSSLEEPLTISRADSTELQAELSATEQSSVGEVVTFDAGDSEPTNEIVEYRWDFTGDGDIDEISETPTEEYRFEDADEYNVTVTVVDEDGDTDTVTTTVSVSQAVEAQFEANTTTVDVGGSVGFDASNAVGTDLTYEWSLGDETRTGAQVEKRFDSAGVYDVALNVTDAVNQVAQDSMTIEVLSPSASLSAPEEATVGETVELSASQSTGFVGNVEYEWRIENESVDMTTESTYETPPFEEAGEYTLSVTVTDSPGREDTATTTIEVLPGDSTASLSVPQEATVGETVELSADQSTGFVGDVEYEWRIDNESVGTPTESTYEAVFEEAGEYNLSVTVTDSSGREDTVTALIEITEAIHAVPTVSNDSVVEGETISFNGMDSTGQITAYEWTFHDNETAIGAQVNQTFDDAGTYNATLTVTDGDGQTHSNTTTVEVLPSGPTASLSVPEEATVGDTIELNASRSSGLEGNESYEWSISGETVDTTMEPVTTISFDEAGTVDISVTVTDENERSDTDTTTVSVSQAVEARFEANTTTVEGGEPIEFDASSSTGPDLTYEWAFGDGNNATGERIVHTFDTEDEYVVELTVQTADGEEDTSTTNVTVAGSEDDESDGTGSGNDSGNSGEGDSSGSSTSSGSSSGSGSSTTSGSGSSTTSGSGGSGGSSGASPPSEITADVTTDDSGTVRLNASNVEAGVPIVAEMDVGDAVRLESVTIEPDDTHDEFTATIVRAEGQMPPDIPSGYGDLFEINATGSISSIEYEFSVAAETIRSANIDGENLTAYRFDEEWIELDSVVEDDGDRYRMAVGVDGDERIGIGSIEEIDSTESTESVGEVNLIDVRLESDRIEAGESVTVTGVFGNGGTAPGEHQAELLVEGSAAAIENVTVDANGTGTVTFEQRFENPGSFEIGVDDQTKTVHVMESGTTASIEPEGAEQGFDPELTYMVLIVGIGSVAVISLFIVARKRGRTLR